MKKTLLLIFLLLNFGAIAQKNSKQIEFTYDNKKITGTLKNSLKNLISEVEVKVDNKDLQKFRIEKITDITIDNELYIPSFSEIDINLNSNRSYFNNKPNPNFKTEWILLKSIVQGDYNLYSYELSNFTQFYFSSPISKQIEPLVYKEYFVNSRITKPNVQFQNQLYKDAPQPDLGFLEYKKIKYKKDKLIKYFNKLNNYDLEKGISKTTFNVSVFGGISMNNFNPTKIGRGTPFETALNLIGIEYLNKFNSGENYYSPTIGVAIEIPFTEKKESMVYTNLSFSSYHNKFYLKENPFGNKNINYEVKSSVILFNVGYKHYFNISNNIRFYAQGAASIITYINSKNHATWENKFGQYSDDGFKTANNFGGTLGLGLKLNNHYFIEANFRESLNSGNSTTTFTLGYTF